MADDTTKKVALTSGIISGLAVSAIAVGALATMLPEGRRKDMGMISVLGVTMASLTGALVALVVSNAYTPAINPPLAEGSMEGVRLMR